MKRITLMILSFMVFVSALAAQEIRADLEKEKAAIEEAARDYMEGWYEGNVERMTKALHPELVKRAPVPLPTGRMNLQFASGSNMVEYTRAGFGKANAKKMGNVEITIFHVSRNTASAMATSGEYIDYIHLVKIDKEWKILNVLWEPANPATPPPPKKEK